MAKDAYSLIDYLGWKKVSLIGYSMGALIAMEFTSTFSEITESIILMGINKYYFLNTFKDQVVVILNVHSEQAGLF
jgi:pimeloyl-ACP methyl ester carboxylesterase